MEPSPTLPRIRGTDHQENVGWRPDSSPIEKTIARVSCLRPTGSTSCRKITNVSSIRNCSRHGQTRLAPAAICGEAQESPQSVHVVPDRGAGAGASVPGVAGAECAVDSGEREVGQRAVAATEPAQQVFRPSETAADRGLGPAPFLPHVILELRDCRGVRMDRDRRNLQTAREAQPASGPRDEIAAGIAGIPAATGGMLRGPPLGGGRDLRRRNLAFLAKFQVMDRLYLEGGDTSEREWPGTLLGAVAEVGKAGPSQRSAKVSLNRVGSLKELVEFEHGRTSFLKGK